MRLEADVAVVGAGPAGSAAAITLAAQGVRVVLVDRAWFPRGKVCGDGLTPRALAALDRLGVWTAIEPHAHVVESLQTLDLRTAATWVGPIPSRLGSQRDRGAIVRRDLLDDALRRRAVSMGAAFQGGVAVDRVEHLGAGRYLLSGGSNQRRWECSSRIVIVADGAGGRLGAHVRGSGGSMLDGIAVRQYWRLPSVVPSTFTICVPLESRDRSYAGYGWIFPVSAEIANVGVGLYGVHDGRELRRAYGAFMTRLCEIDRAWMRAVPCGNPQGGLLRSGGSLADLVRGGIVLAGDAAAVTNPFTGEGIAQALDSGEIAASAALEDFESPGQLAPAFACRMREAFPQTTRVAEHLPWLVARAEHFVSEFWASVSPPLGVIGRAARRVALEEHLRSGVPGGDQVIARTWTQIRALVGSDFPLLTQLLDAVRDESEVALDAPLQRFWEEYGYCRDQRIPEIDDIAQLLCLGSLMCVIAGGTCAEAGIPSERAAHGAPTWAVNAVALGAADILMARFFAIASRIPPTVSAACSKALSRAFGALCEHALEDAGAASIERMLHGLATDFKSAARTCGARAA